MKNLEREDISKFLNRYLPKIIGFNGISKDANKICTCIFTTQNPSELLSAINASAISELNDFIKEEMHENYKEYNRSIVLYESEERQNSLILRWT
jgi:hypothetical protein